MNLKNVKLSVILCLMRNGVKAIFYTLRHGERFVVHGKQFWAKDISFEILDGGSIKIGKCLQTRRGCTFIAHGGSFVVGDDCFMNSNVSVTAMESVEIGERCAIGQNVVIVDHDHDFRNRNGKFATTPVSIGSDTWIGANSVILRGTKIGKGCVIAAGSVVRGTILDGCVLYQKREGTVRRINKA